jgi:hypothetical protein
MGTTRHLQLPESSSASEVRARPQPLRRESTPRELVEVGL